LALTWLAILLFFAPNAGTTRQTLADRIYTIPPSDWRYVEVVVREPAAIECEFHILSGAPAARVALVNQQSLAQWRRGLRNQTIASTPRAASGQFWYPVRETGEYSVIVDNMEGRVPVQVQLRVALDFSGSEPRQVGRLSTGRRVAVVGISLALFLGIVTYSGRKLLAAWR
jgi:hypothetical protein